MRTAKPPSSRTKTRLEDRESGPSGPLTFSCFSFAPPVIAGRARAGRSERPQNRHVSLWLPCRLREVGEVRVFLDKNADAASTSLHLWIFTGIHMGMPINAASLTITPPMLALIAEIDEFKGAWRALGTLAPDRLSALRRVATIESIGSSTRIEGSKLSDSDVERLLSNIEIRHFATRDEQEVAGYAEVMETVFASFDAIAPTENHIRQLHRDLLAHSSKDARHRGSYKTGTNHVVAFDADGKEIGVVFETATPFDTPRLMLELVERSEERRGGKEC